LESGRLMEGGRLIGGRLIEVGLYTNTSGSLGEQEMPLEHEPQASVSTAFSSSPKLSRVLV